MLKIPIKFGFVPKTVSLGSGSGSGFRFETVYQKFMFYVLKLSNKFVFFVQTVLVAIRILIGLRILIILL